MNRREFLGGSGAMIVAFSLLPRMARAAKSPDLDAWLAIGADGKITAFTGKCDLGQGIATAQVQLVAEELSVAMSKVTLAECDTALTPDQGTTSGSQSTPTNFNTENLALAAATAREALLGLAAKRLGTKRLAIDDGVISGGGRSVSYGELIGGKRFELPLDKKAKRRPMTEWKTLGQPLTSIDRVALVTGQFEYVHHVRVPGMLHGRVVRPPQLGATLVSVGKVAGAQVVVKQDFVGVVAETQYAAMIAAQRLEVEWKPGPALPAQATFFDWLRAQPHDQIAVEGAVATPTHRATYTFPYQSHGSVGPSCAVADVRSDGVTVWSPTQSAFPTRSCIAMLLGIPVERVRVIFKRGSGCYGLNGADAVSFDAAVLSQAVGKPVRVQYTRADEFASENFGSACAIEHRATLDGGAIAAWDREAWVASLGNRPGSDTPGNVITGMLLGHAPESLDKPAGKRKAKKVDNNSNAIPAYVASAGGTVKRERIVTHTVKSPFLTGPLRSPLRIQNTFANESFVDELAAAAGADPVAFRERHLRDPRVLGVLRAAAKAADWKPPTRARTGRGRGVACVAYEGQNGYAALVADVEVDASGVIRPRRYVVAIDCGPISNPDGLRNQVEGGLLQGTSRALVEQITWDEQRVTSLDWSTYASLHLDFELPEIEIVTVVPSGVPATGAGETSITLVPAALANAVFDATGARLRDVPFTPERVLRRLG